jgi:hypothetical protein
LRGAVAAGRASEEAGADAGVDAGVDAGADVTGEEEDVGIGSRSR